MLNERMVQEIGRVNNEPRSRSHEAETPRRQEVGRVNNLAPWHTGRPAHAPLEIGRTNNALLGRPAAGPQEIGVVRNERGTH